MPFRILLIELEKKPRGFQQLTAPSIHGTFAGPGHRLLNAAAPGERKATGALEHPARDATE